MRYLIVTIFAFALLTSISLAEDCDVASPAVEWQKCINSKINGLEASSSLGASSNFEPFALTMYRAQMVLPKLIEPRVWERVLFEVTINESPGAAANYGSGVFNIGRDGVYAVSVISRINALSNSASSDDDVYFRIVTSDGTSVNMYKGSGTRRDSVAGSVYLFLKSGEWIAVEALLADSKDNASVPIDNIYASIALIK